MLPNISVGIPSHCKTMAKNNDRKIGKGGNCGIFSSGITGIVYFRLNLSARSSTRTKAPISRGIVEGDGAMSNLILTNYAKRN